MRAPLLILCALTALPCGGATPPWINIGPPGGEARSLASNARTDTTFVLNPRSGVFRTVAGGAWSLVFDALARHVTPTRVTVDPQTSRVYIGTTTGLFRSDDQGTSWRLVLDESIVDVSASYDLVMASTANELFRSGNAGGSWTSIPSPPSSVQTTVTLLRLDPRSEDRLVAVIEGNLFRSADRGTSWEALAPKNIAAAFFGDSLYVGGADGVYECDTACTRLGSDAAVDVTQWRTEIYEATSDGVFRLDRQQHRFGLVEGFPDAAVLSLAPTASALLAGTTAGVLRSDDGTRWTNANDGFDNVRITAMAKAAQSIVAATQGEGMMRDQNGSWSPAYAGLPGRPPAAPVTRNLAFDGATLYAAFPDNGLFRSINDGLTWEDISAGLFSRYTLDVAGGGGVAVAATVTGLLRSIDRGATWQRFAAYPSGSARSVALRGSTIAAASGATAIVSTDGGTTWQANDLPALIRGLAVAGTRVYATTDQGIFARNQNGWNGPLLDAARPNAITATGTRLYVSTAAGIVYTEDGATWFHVPGSETLPPDITALLADDESLYAGTDGGSIFSAPVAPRHRVVRR
jgi:hypothetical protein